MKIVGFTGTHHGMTPGQLARLRDYILQLAPDVFHHGMCIGADAEAHNLVRELFPHCQIIGHAGVNSNGVCPTRAEVHCDLVLEPRPYLIRDKHIVNAVRCMLAAPATRDEMLRSGTWATVRYARKVNRLTYMVYP